MIGQGEGGDGEEVGKGRKREGQGNEDEHSCSLHQSFLGSQTSLSKFQLLNLRLCQLSSLPDRHTSISPINPTRFNTIQSWFSLALLF